jgi:hypothetical protein
MWSAECVHNRSIVTRCPGPPAPQVRSQIAQWRQQSEAALSLPEGPRSLAGAAHSLSAGAPRGAEERRRTKAARRVRDGGPYSCEHGCGFEDG